MRIMLIMLVKFMIIIWTIILKSAIKESNYIYVPRRFLVLITASPLLNNFLLDNGNMAKFLEEINFWIGVSHSNLIILFNLLFNKVKMCYISTSSGIKISFFLLNTLNSYLVNKITAKNCVSTIYHKDKLRLTNN